MPANLLIADRANNRVIEVTPDRKIVWEFPRPGDLPPGQRFRWPDDAFYAPDGKSIVINEEESHAIVLVDYATTGSSGSTAFPSAMAGPRAISMVPMTPTCGPTAASGWRTFATAA